MICKGEKQMSSIREFKYTNSKGESKKHLIFALSETPDYLMGIDVESVLKNIVDANDTSRTDPKEHSVWCNDNYVIIFTKVVDETGKTELSIFDNCNLSDVVSVKNNIDAELGEEREKFFLDIVIYNKDHTKIDVDTLNSFIHDYKIDNITDFVNKIDTIGQEATPNYSHFCQNLLWISLEAENKNNVTIPGWKSMIEAFNNMSKVFENREPTQYQSLQESRSGEKKPIEGFDESWIKAFRNFKKSGIAK